MSAIHLARVFWKVQVLCVISSAVRAQPVPAAKLEITDVKQSYRKPEALRFTVRNLGEATQFNCVLQDYTPNDPLTPEGWRQLANIGVPWNVKPAGFRYSLGRGKTITITWSPWHWSRERVLRTSRQYRIVIRAPLTKEENFTAHVSPTFELRLQ